MTHAQHIQAAPGDTIVRGSKAGCHRAAHLRTIVTFAAQAACQSQLMAVVRVHMSLHGRCACRLLEAGLRP